MKIPYWLKFIFILITLFLISLAILRSTHVHNEFPQISSDTAERAVFLDLPLTTADGKIKNLSEFKGKVLLISFWASWCGPCLEELPHFALLQKKFPEKLTVLPINQDDSVKTRQFIDVFWKKYGINFPSYFDPGYKIAKQVNLEVLPTNIVLDHQGRKVFEGIGYVDWLGDDAQKMLSELIAEIK